MSGTERNRTRKGRVEAGQSVKKIGGDERESEQGTNKRKNRATLASWTNKIK